MSNPILSILIAVFPLLKNYPATAQFMSVLIGFFPAIAALCTFVVQVWKAAVLFLTIAQTAPVIGPHLAALANFMSVEETTIENDAGALVAFLNQFSALQLPKKKKLALKK